MNSYPNSDPKQSTITKLGCVHSVHTQNLGRAHTARSVLRWCALLRAQQIGRARMRTPLRAAWPAAPTPVTTQSPGRDTKWPNILGQVTTSIPGHDLKKSDLGCDLQKGSRLRFPCQTPNQVATSFSGRDLLNDQARSRRQSPHRNLLPAQPNQTRS